MSERDFKQLSLGITRKPKKNPFKQKEQELLNWIIDYVRLKGHFIQRINAGKQYIRDGSGKITRVIHMAEAGTPDLCGHTKKGQALYIEVKVKPNTPSAEQIQFIERARQDGCIAEVIYSQEEIINLLQEL